MAKPFLFTDDPPFVEMTPFPSVGKRDCFLCNQYNTTPRKKTAPGKTQGAAIILGKTEPYFNASSTATAQATVAPTMGLLPMPLSPIISTWAGTEEDPANWASPCIRPMESVRP